MMAVDVQSESGYAHMQEYVDLENFADYMILHFYADAEDWPHHNGYAAANRGISLLTETWARMGAPQVRVNELMLGFFDTRHGAETKGWDLLSDTQKQALIDHTLLPRTGSVDDVVKAVRFIIKDAPFMTGAVLRLDGGYVLGGEKVPDMPPGVL